MTKDLKPKTFFLILFVLLFFKINWQITQSFFSARNEMKDLNQSCEVMLNKMSSLEIERYSDQASEFKITPTEYCIKNKNANYIGIKKQIKPAITINFLLAALSSLLITGLFILLKKLLR